MDYSVSVESTGEAGRSINIAVERAVFEKKVKDAMSKTARGAKLKGFRPGKVPFKVIENLYGAEIRRDVLADLWRGAFDSAVKDHSLDVVELKDFKVDGLESAEDVKIRIDVALRPQPAISGYLGVACRAEVAAYEEKLLDEELARLQKQMSKVEPVKDREVVEHGDVVQFSFEATVEGAPFAGSHNDNAYAEIGSGLWASDLEAKLVGLKVGQEQEVTVHFGDDYEVKEVAGKDSVHKVLVKGIYKREVCELTDEFVKESGLGDDLAMLKGKLRSSIEQRIEQENENRRWDAVMKVIEEKNPFEIPQVMIDSQIRDMLIELEVLNPKDENSFRAQVERFREPLSKPAEFRVRRAIILNQVIKQESLEASEEECEAWVDEQAKGIQAQREELVKHFGSAKSSAQLKNIVVHDKAMKLLLGSAKIETVSQQS